MTDNEPMRLGCRELENIKEAIGKRVTFKQSEKGKHWDTGKCIGWTADMLFGFYAAPLFCVIEADTGGVAVVPEKLVRMT